MTIGALTGHRGDSLWSQSTGPLDFYDAKGAVQALLERLGANLVFEQAEDEMFHPGRTALVLANGHPVGVVGELHPAAKERFDLDVPVVACFELDLGLLLAQLPSKRHSYQSFSRFPTADRDLAILVDESTPQAGCRRSWRTILW